MKAKTIKEVASYERVTDYDDLKEISAMTKNYSYHLIVENGKLNITILNLKDDDEPHIDLPTINFDDIEWLISND